MNIILNERQYAMDAISSLSMDKNRFNTINRVARYYRTTSKNDADAVRMTEEFVLRCDSAARLIYMRPMIESSVRSLRKRPLIEIESVRITESEMKKIASLRSIQAQTVLFSMLCLAKFWNAVNDKNNGWVNRTYSELFKLANVQCSEERKAQIMQAIFGSGLGGYSLRATSENTCVKFIDDASPVVLEVYDFSDLGYQYRKFIGQPYMECASCGKLIRRKTNNQKYCKDCAPEMALELKRVKYK